MKKIYTILGLAALFLMTSFIAKAHAYVIQSTDQCIGDRRDGRCILRCLELYNGSCSLLECTLPNGQSHRADFSFTYDCAVAGGGSLHSSSAREFRELCEEANDEAEAANQCEDQTNSLHDELTNLGREVWDLSGRLSGCQLTSRRLSSKLNRICQETARLNCVSSQTQELGCRIREIAGCQTLSISDRPLSASRPQ